MSNPRSPDLRASDLKACLPSRALLCDHLITFWSSQLPLTEKFEAMGVLARAGRWYRAFLLEGLQTIGRPLSQPSGTTA
jgi:hypothetical protein